MTFEQIRIFLAVAEREHVTRAAQFLNLTQSTVSNAISALEARHKVKLFHRIGRRIELTEEGRIFMDDARNVLASMRTAETTLADLAGTPRGILSVFASQTIASYWLPQYVVQFRERYPQVDLRIEAGNTEQCVRSVLSGSSGLGFIEGPICDPALSMHPVARDRLVIVVAANHPWAGRNAPHLSELHELQWALREKGSGTRSSLEEALRTHGIEEAQLKIALELPSNEAVCNAVAHSMLATAVSEYVVQSGVDAGKFAIVPFELPSRTFNVIRQKERHQGRANKAFLELIEESARACGRTPRY